MSTPGNQPWSGREQRREDRAEVALDVEIKAGGRRYLGLIRLLSPYGAWIELLDADPFPHEGSVTLVSESLGEPIGAALRYKRHGTEGLVKGLGVEFVMMGGGAREHVAAVIAGRGRP